MLLIQRCDPSVSHSFYGLCSSRFAHKWQVRYKWDLESVHWWISDSLLKMTSSLIVSNSKVFPLLHIFWQRRESTRCDLWKWCRPVMVCYIHSKLPQGEEAVHKPHSGRSRVVWDCVLRPVPLGFGVTGGWCEGRTRARVVLLTRQPGTLDVADQLLHCCGGNRVGIWTWKYLNCIDYIELVVSFNFASNSKN